MPTYEGHDDRWKAPDLEEEEGRLLDELRQAVHADELVAYRRTDDDPRRAREEVDRRLRGLEVAPLGDEELQRLRETESRLGASLIAYRRT